MSGAQGYDEQSHLRIQAAVRKIERMQPAAKQPHGSKPSIDVRRFRVTEGAPDTGALSETDASWAREMIQQEPGTWQVTDRCINNLFPADPETIGAPEGSEVWAYPSNGCWWAFALVIEGTGTTTSTTTPPNPCGGSCKWIWSASANQWTLDTDNCANTTTTTSTTTTTFAPGITTTSTTTTTDRPRCKPPTTTTSTTSTTTTTPDCNCVYPTFCGFADGDCTYTSCSQAAQSVSQPAMCTSTTSPNPGTTTTTCDCNQFTTPAPNPTSTTPGGPGPGNGCGTGCDWVCGLNNVWGLVSHGCIGLGATTNGCRCNGCQTPTSPCTCGETLHADCAYDCTPVPPPPPPTPCSGNCLWYVGPTGSFARMSFGCRAGDLGGSCDCQPPSGATPCSWVSTPCGNGFYPGPGPDPNPGPGPGPGGGPCSNCTTTPNPSTSTPPPPCTECFVRADGTGWEVIADHCAGNGCQCGIPASEPIDSCEVRRVGCVTSTTTTTAPTTTTTTTSTTTTTTAPLGLCCFYKPATDDFECEIVSQATCAGRLGSPGGGSASWVDAAVYSSCTDPAYLNSFGFNCRKGPCCYSNSPGVNPFVCVDDKTQYKCAQLGGASGDYCWTPSATFANCAALQSTLVCSQCYTTTTTTSTTTTTTTTACPSCTSPSSCSSGQSLYRCNPSGNGWDLVATYAPCGTPAAPATPCTPCECQCTNCTGCFPAGTLVDGPTPKPIESLRIGDTIYSGDGERLTSVEKIWSVETNRLVVIEAGGIEIHTTSEHPFRLSTGEFAEAQFLIAGQMLGDQRINAVKEIPLASPVKVYNVTVSEPHTFRVGRDGIFVEVHNK